MPLPALPLHQSINKSITACTDALNIESRARSFFLRSSYCFSGMEVEDNPALVLDLGPLKQAHSDEA